MDDTTKKYLDGKFQGVSEHLKRVDENFQGVSEHLKRVDENFQGVSEHLKRVDEKVDGLATTQTDIMTLIDKRFDNVEDKLDSVINQVSGHEKRVGFLEDKVLQ